MDYRDIIHHMLERGHDLDDDFEIQIEGIKENGDKVNLEVSDCNFIKKGCIVEVSMPEPEETKSE